MARRRGGRVWMGRHFEELWQAAYRPWLEAWGRAAWSEDELVLAVVPSRKFSGWLHERALRDGLNFAGIRFWTPALLRREAAACCGMAVASVEEMDLLAAAVAAEWLEEAPDDRLAQAAARDGRMLAAVWDEALGAGADPRSLGEPLARGLRRWKGLVGASGRVHGSEIDRRAGQLLAESRRGIRALLIAGFGGSHWQEWPLLASVAGAAQEATAAFLSPRAEGEAWDQLWIGSWEQLIGPAEAADAVEVPSPLARYAEMWCGDGAQLDLPQRQILFAQAADVAEEARVAAALAVRFLSSGECERMGVVVPGRGPLAREVSRCLLAAGIPHDDAFGHAAPGAWPDSDWASWLAYQQEGGIDRLERLAGDLPEPARKRVGLDLDGLQLQKTVREAYRVALFDDVDVLRRVLESRGRSEVAQALARLGRMPAAAEVREYAAWTRKAARQLGWEDRLEAGEAGLDWAGGVRRRVTREAWLEWLAAWGSRESQVRIREEEASQLYAKVHLVSYADAEVQAWSHLIFTSQSEGVWPPRPPERVLLPEAVREAWNAAVRMQRRRVGRGRQGEGHWAVEPELSLLVPEAAARDWARRQMTSLLESVAVAAALTYRDADGDTSGLGPSEAASRLFFLDRGQSITSRVQQELAARARSEAAAWEQAVGGTPEMDIREELPRVAEAHRHRRDEASPFGAYEFGFGAGGPPARLVLSCSQWEAAVNFPAPKWMEYYLGVAGLDPVSADNLAQAARGAMAHRWLAAIVSEASGCFGPTPDGAEALRLIAAAAHAERAELEGWLTEAGRSLPEWWNGLWQEAHDLAAELAFGVFRHQEFPSAATEVALPRLEMETAAGPLTLFGRVDCVLSREALPAGALLGEARRVVAVDYKTGRRSALLVPEQIAQGRGVQIALYVEALRAAGLAEAEAAVLTLEKAGDWKPALGAETGPALAGLWSGLARMEATGTLGMRGELRPEFGLAARMPLATLPLDPDLLEAKWALTHPEWGGMG